MFVFLSKLVPIFVYPLGLAVLFLILATLWRRSDRVRKFSLLIALLIILISSNAWVAGILTRTLEWQYLPAETYPKVEAIVVLGGTTGSATYPRQQVDIGGAGDRIIYAADLYHSGLSPNLLLTGGYIPWLNNRQAPAHDMAEIFTLLGVPEGALWLETKSRNTYENAVFSKDILQPKGISKIILVTSAAHMPRAVAVFKNQGFEVIPAPSDYNFTQSDWDRLWEINLTTQLFNLLPTVDHLNDTTDVLKEYIGILVYKLRGWS